eukprot:m.165351 g.165351  ORF g.165351 m.165351 type:complete len:785 (+) comp17154_c0_seq1:229-2583(+)
MSGQVDKPLLRMQAPPPPAPRPGTASGVSRLEFSDEPPIVRPRTFTASGSSSTSSPAHRTRSSTVSGGASSRPTVRDGVPPDLTSTVMTMQKFVKASDRLGWSGWVKDVFSGKEAVDYLRKHGIARNEFDTSLLMNRMLHFNIIIDAKTPSSKFFSPKMLYSWVDVAKWGHGDESGANTVSTSTSSSFRKSHTDPIGEETETDNDVRPLVEPRKAPAPPPTSPKPAPKPAVTIIRQKADLDSNKIYDPIDGEDWEDVKMPSAADDKRAPSPGTRPVSTVSGTSEAGLGKPIMTHASSSASSIQQGSSATVRVSWSGRAEVVQAGLPQTMSRDEIVLQESLYELVSSEESYLADLKVLIDIVYNALKVVASQYDFMLTKQQKASSNLREKVQALQASATTLHKYGIKFLSELKARRDEGLIMTKVSDIFEHWISVFGLAFYDYYRNFVPLKAWAHASSKELSIAVERTDIHHQVKGRLVDGFLMVACQRIMRYPMLLKEICKNMKKVPSFDAERLSLEELGKMFDTVCHKCNTLVAFSEGRMELEEINAVLDWKNMMQPKNLSDSDTRVLVRREPLELVQVQSDKITKAQNVELLLLTDCVLCVKQLKKKDADVVKLQVWYYFERQMVSCYDRASVEGRELFMLEGFAPEREILTFAAKSGKSKKEWIKLMTTPEEEGLYEPWDCPIAKVIKDFTPTSFDEILLFADDYVKILERGEVRSRGIVENGDIHPREGYFPNSHVVEVPSMHDARKQLVNEGKLPHARRRSIDVGRKSVDAAAAGSTNA